MSTFTAILLAGGIGKRSGKSIPKQFALLRGRPMITYGMELLAEIEEVTEIIVTYPEGFRKRTEEVISSFMDKKRGKIVKLVKGGMTRQESVYLALKECTNDNVIIHEAARPLATSKYLNDLINCKEEAATLAFSVPFTVLTQKNGVISGILNRDELVNIQLPQKFPFAKLLEYHEKAIKEGKRFTDDSSLFFVYLGKVAVIKGASENIKITDWKDFLIAEAILGDRYE